MALAVRALPGPAHLQDPPRGSDSSADGGETGPGDRAAVRELGGSRTSLEKREVSS